MIDTNDVIIAVQEGGNEESEDQGAVDAFVDSTTNSFESALGTFGEMLPRLLVALVVIWATMRIVPYVAGKIAGMLENLGTFRRIERTPLVSSGAAAEPDGGVSGALVSRAETALRLYGYVVGLAIAVAYLGVGMLSDVAVDAGYYATYLLVALAVVSVAAVIAAGVGDRAARWEPVAGTVAAPALSGGVQAFLYLVAGVIVLDLLGLHTGIIVAVVDSLAFGLAVAFALAVGIGVGWGSKDRVADYVAGLLGDDGTDRRAPAAESDDD